MNFHENHRRSLVKAVTFRAFVLTSDAVVIFMITHRFDTTFTLVIFSNTLSTIIYFFHERLWNHIEWGRNKRKKSGLTRKKSVNEGYRIKEVKDNLDLTP